MSDLERKPEFDANGWCHDISLAPHDGTPLLLQREPGEWPFIAHWGNPYRYQKQGKSAWIGHEAGLHEDSDGLSWKYLVDPREIQR